MTVELKPYDLPDIAVMNSDLPEQLMIWQPDRTLIVLGQSNNPDVSLMADEVIKDKIEVYRRPSGGETVVLTANTLVISISFTTKKVHNPQLYFKRINQRIISGLGGLGIKDLQHKGISDIAVGDRKILGSAIYRSRNRVFYHAVLNAGEHPAVISKYLLHPLREPEYRNRRAHIDFVTSLVKEGYDVSLQNLRSILEKELNQKNTFIYE